MIKTLFLFLKPCGIGKVRLGCVQLFGRWLTENFSLIWSGATEVCPPMIYVLDVILLLNPLCISLEIAMLSNLFGTASLGRNLGVNSSA
jgi:hypothetical protein